MADKGRSMDKMSEETFDFICTNCDSNGKIVEAVRYCIECRGYCCQTCTDTHTTIVMLKNHNLLDASQGNQASNQPGSLPEFPTERCTLHKGKVIDMYCEDHNEVGCSTCISTNHRTCPEKSIYSIPDMIDTLFKLGDCKQIQSRLRDMMVSLTTLGKSKNDRLEDLQVIKKEEMNKVTKFQKALESIIRKAGDATRNEIESKYKELEKEILQEKQDAERNEASLKESGEKNKKAEGNRAQRFVCSKVAEKKIKEAEIQISKQTGSTDDGRQLAFKPDQSLMKYLNRLHGIGMVNVITKKKTDLYQMKGSKDINIKVNDDSETCYSASCCLTYDNQLLVTDNNNNELKLINTHTMRVVDNCQLNDAPCGVCCINDNEVAVACGYADKIQFVSYGKKMTPTRHINTSHFCYGISIRNDKIYVTDCEYSLYIYDMTGNLLQTISQDNAGNKLFSCSSHVTFSESGDRMYVSDGNKGVVCFDGKGNYQSSFSDSVLKNADGVCLDGRGNIFVVGYNSYNVVQFNQDGKKIGAVIKRQNGLLHPRSICCDPKMNRLFVTMSNSKVVKMFELHR
ncbi:hypothetical protein ACF0H5_019624 [Mactra antiquata]